MGVETCLTGQPDGTYLVINSDDFGHCHAINQGIMAAFQDGTITSSCMMPPCAWACEAIRFLQENPRFPVGVHVTLASSFDNNEIRPFLPARDIPSLVDELGFFHHTTEDFQRLANPEHARMEIEAQIDWVLSQGIQVSHLDDHMSTLTGYPETNTTFHSVLYDTARKYGLPVINYENYGDPLDLFARCIEISDVETDDKAGWIVKELESLAPGLYAIICHLAVPADELAAMCSRPNPWTEQYRITDCEALHDVRVREVIERKGITLTNLKEVGEAMSGAE